MAASYGILFFSGMGIENTEGMMESRDGNDVVVEEVGGVHGERGIGLGNQTYGGDVDSFVDFLLETVWKGRDIEVFLQCLPACGVGGLEGGNVEGEGVVDPEALDMGYGEVRVVGIAAVEVADPPAGSMVGQPQGERCRQKAERHDEGPEEVAFHACECW